MGCRFITLYPFAGRPQGDVIRDFNSDLVEVEDIDGHMVDWFKKACHLDQPVALLRPDKFSFAVTANTELDGVIQQLKLQLDLVNAKEIVRSQPRVAQNKAAKIHITSAKQSSEGADYDTTTK